jgi:hypothetical protein
VSHQCRSSNFYGRLDRHARADIQIGRLVENDLDRDALNDLHEIAGGILGRKQSYSNLSKSRFAAFRSGRRATAFLSPLSTIFATT